MHHIKARPHSRETLQEMVAIAEPNLDRDIISKITGLHLYLRDVVGEGGRRPNTRDLLRAASEALKGDDYWRLSVVDSYLFYIENGLKGNEAIADSLRFLSSGANEYIPRSDVVPARVMKALAQVGLPSYIGEINFVIDPGCAKMGAAGYFKAKTGAEKAHTIAISPQAIKSGRWPEVILHEVRHALNDCGEGVYFGDLEQDIKDLRNQASFADLVPGSRLMELTPEEKSLLNRIKNRTAYLTSERDFRLLMAVIAKTDDETLRKTYLNDTVSINTSEVLSLARKHFDLIREISTCFAKRSFGGEFPSRAELHGKQVRLTEIVAEIFEDYRKLPEEDKQRIESDPLDSPIEDNYDPQEMLRDLEKSFGLPKGSLSGPEGVTHDSGKSNASSSLDNIIALKDPKSKTELSKTPELSEEDKRIILAAQSRASQADSSLWQCPKELWEEVVSEWSETSVSNGRRSDPNGALQIDEIFSGVRPEDARVSPGADVDRERKVIRIVDLNSTLTPDDLGLFQKLFALGFAVALGDREPVSSCVALCIQEGQQAGNALVKSEVEKKLSPAERRCSEVLSMEELKSHLEAVAAYAAITKGVELREKKRAGEDISLAKKIVWPTLQDAPKTDKLVLEYLEDNESLMSKLRELTRDITKIDGQTEIELYMRQLEAELGQKEEPEEDKVPKDNEEMAEMALQSYEYDPFTGVSTFVRPRGVTDVQLMRALNGYFRKHYPSYNRDAIYDGDIAWYDKLPTDFPDHCHQGRDYSPNIPKSSRTITITSLVSDSTGKTRDDQGQVLKGAGLSFSDPRDIALAAALHACKYNGEDLLKNKWVRGSVPGFALGTGAFSGVFVDGYGVDGGFARVGASGSPRSPELKN